MIGSFLRSRIYAFRAERLRIGKSASGAASLLQNDASNLPEVISNLQANPTRFHKFTAYVREIFPHIHNVSAVPKENHSVEIVVWPLGIGDREDLVIPLSESGTGVSQVLAILYVVLAANEPQTIVVDEPQSFLHPGAARKLIEILADHSQHQFILATHSPNLLFPVEPSTITLIRKIESESVVESVDINEQKDLNRLLYNLGAKLSDVFGADSILWVEGKTEELCYPQIIRSLLNRSLLGTTVVGVSSTGDFDGRHASLIIELYRRLSQGKGLIPPAIGFIFDSEEPALFTPNEIEGDR